jgi:outer membrane protein W
MCAKYGRLLFVILVALPGAGAVAQEAQWIVRGVASYLATADDDSTFIAAQPPPLGEETFQQSVEDGASLGVSVEYLWRDRLGIEATASLSSHDVEMVISNDLGTFPATDSTRFRMFTLGANYHFETEGRIRWSVGGFVPLLFADGTDHVFPDLNRTEGRAYDQDYGVGIKGGLEWSFAPESPWTVSVEGRYMFLLIMESEGVGDIDVDPVVLTVGVGYRF